MSAADTQLRLRIPADAAKVAGVRQAVEKFCADHGFDARACEEFGLCVNEALANVIRHAYRGAKDKSIDISMQLQGDSMHMWIRDWGSGVNPLDPPPGPHDPLKPGGLGLICLQRMMDQVTFTPQPDGMLLEMARKRNHG